MPARVAPLVPEGAEGLGGVLDEEEVELRRNVDELFHVAQVAEDVRRRQRAHPAPGRFFIQGAVLHAAFLLAEAAHLRRVDAQRVVAVDEDRLAAAVADGVGGRDKAEVGRQHGVAALDARFHEREMQPRRAALAGDGLPGADEGGDVLSNCEMYGPPVETHSVSTASVRYSSSFPRRLGTDRGMNLSGIQDRSFLKSNFQML